MKTNTPQLKMKTVKYGLQINTQMPVIDWHTATRANVKLENAQGLVVTNNHKSDELLLTNGQTSLSITPTPTSQNKLDIIVPQNCKCTVFVRVESQSTSNYQQKLTVNAGENSQLTLILLQVLESNSNGFFDITLNVKKNSTVNVMSLDVSGKFIQRSVVANLQQEGAQCYQKILSLCANQDHDLYTASHHNAPNTNSDILTRAAVLDNAKSISRSLVKISPNAFGSQGYEKQEALILSKTGEADAIPNLEIHNHDVKCSHGSTIGQLDEEKIYYLTSRGLSRKQAIGLLIEGFYDPIIKTIPDQKVCQLVYTCIRKLFGEENN